MKIGKKREGIQDTSSMAKSERKLKILVSPILMLIFTADSPSCGIFNTYHSDTNIYS